jgi:hypothetical protein
MPSKEQVQRNCDCLMNVLKDPSLRLFSGIVSFLNEALAIKTLAEKRPDQANLEFNDLVDRLRKIPTVPAG